MEDPPVPTTRESFSGRDIGQEQYDIAQEQGIAVCFAAWSRDGRTTLGPVILQRSFDFDLQMYLSESKSLREKGRCLHFDSGRRCDRLIGAHSIQKNGALSMIAEKGKVYAISMNFGDIRKNKGVAAYTKQGINKVSVFRGFCREHDNQLFGPIDRALLVPTKQQVLLYAYRALCRELLVKENALALQEKWKQRCVGQAALHEVFRNMSKGTELGLNNLLRQKAKFDTSLRERSFGDIKSVLFCSNQSPKVVFSGVIYPEYDFRGRQIQDLGDAAAVLDLITFSFGPMEEGWGFLFAWHSECSRACKALIGSLAEIGHEGGDIGDCLFRLVISNCENMAISPLWWEALDKKRRKEISAAATCQADVFLRTPPDYLAGGLEGVCDWHFERVVSDMD
jgi:hypothetical protein